VVRLFIISHGWLVRREGKGHTERTASATAAPSGVGSGP
jgi:hypothetical protein